MINLNTTIKAEKSPVMDYSIPVPEGNYNCEIVKIDDWKERIVKSLTVKATGETLTNVPVYNANVQLKITGGEYNNRRLFYNLTTHPNMPWIIPNFLYATSEESATPAQIPSICLGKFVKVHTKIEEREVTKEDKETGLMTKEMKKTNVVTSVNPIEIDSADDMFNV